MSTRAELEYSLRIFSTNIFLNKSQYPIVVILRNWNIVSDFFFQYFLIFYKSQYPKTSISQYSGNIAEPKFSLRYFFPIFSCINLNILTSQIFSDFFLYKSQYPNTVVILWIPQCGTGI